MARSRTARRVSDTLVCRLALGTFILSACVHLKPGGDVADAGTDAGAVAACVSMGVVRPLVREPVHDVDLLLMVDNSGSMSEEQASLATELPRLVRVLSTGDRTGDGVTSDDFPAVVSLHVGVVTTDMGVANFVVPTCTRSPQFGDDGLLRTAGNAAIAGCIAVYPKFLEYQPGISVQTIEQFGADFSCVAAMGTGGCGFEQPLESTLKAVTPSTSATTFFGGTHGHGDVENAGFLRPDSVIAVVLVTDEEDCSVAMGNEEIFNQSFSSPYPGDLNLRCFLYPETQWPVQRYIDGFKALRPDRESLVVFGAITGVPLDLIPSTGSPNYSGILADPRMVEAVDTSPGTTGARLVPSCDVPGRGIAFPPRRIVEVAKGFGESGTVQSICQESFASAVDAVVSNVANALGGCLPRALYPDAARLVGCRVVETIPPPGTFVGQPTSCAGLVGVASTPLRTNADGSLDCEVTHLVATGVAPTGDGWYYDDFSPENMAACGTGGRRVTFSPSVIPVDGITAQLECQMTCTTNDDCPATTVCDGGGCIAPTCVDVTP